MDKHLVGKAPHLRNADYGHSTEVMMRDLLIALSPVILFGIYKNVILVGITHKYDTIYHLIYPLITLIICPLFSVILEALCLFIMKRKEIKSFKDLFLEVRRGFGLFPGLFFYLISPPYLKLWIMLLGVLFGEVVGKMLFGGFGQNVFNPALVGRAFIAFSFSEEISKGYFNPFNEEVFLDAFTGATPLTHYSTLFSAGHPLIDDLISPFNNLFNMFLGFIPGSIGEVSALCCILGYIYLSIRHVIDFKVPLIYIGTVFIVTLTAGLIMGYSIEYPLFQILSGGLFFGAIFMATEPVTSPKTWFGKAMYAMLLGVLTVLFRLVGNLPEGVATAILTMNIFGLVLDKYAIKARVEGKIDKKNLPGLIIFFLVFFMIFAYDIIMIV